MESGGLESHGIAAMSYVLSILRCETRAKLSRKPFVYSLKEFYLSKDFILSVVDVPKISGYGPWCTIQYRFLLTAHVHDGTGLQPRTR